MCRQTVLNCLHWVLLLTAAAVLVVAVGFLGLAAGMDWALGGDPGLSRQNIPPLDEFSTRALQSDPECCLFRWTLS